MPPSERPRVGLTRMDAALDAMRPLGFPAAVVRQSVKDLLKVYGGDPGWGFIEEAAYKLLIETILEQQEEAEREDSESEEENDEQQEEVHDNYQAQGSDEEEEFEDTTCLSIQDNVYSGEFGESGSCVASGFSTTWDEGSAKRRKPCYGWIGEGDDDDDEFVLMELAEDAFTK